MLGSRPGAAETRVVGAHLDLKDRADVHFLHVKRARARAREGAAQVLRPSSNTYVTCMAFFGQTQAHQESQKETELKKERPNSRAPTADLRLHALVR